MDYDSIQYDRIPYSKFVKLKREKRKNSNLVRENKRIKSLGTGRIEINRSINSYYILYVERKKKKKKKTLILFTLSSYINIFSS